MIVKNLRCNAINIIIMIKNFSTCRKEINHVYNIRTNFIYFIYSITMMVHFLEFYALVTLRVEF